MATRRTRAGVSSRSAHAGLGPEATLPLVSCICPTYNRPPALPAPPRGGHRVLFQNSGLWLRRCHHPKLRPMPILCHDHPARRESVAPSLLCSETHTQAQVRRGKDPGSLLCQAQGRDRPRCLERRPTGGGKGDNATLTRLIVAATREAAKGQVDRPADPYPPKLVEGRCSRRFAGS